jgi:hypothetical protein
MKLYVFALLVLSSWLGSASASETITGRWILEGGKARHRFDVEIVPSTDAPDEFWLVNTEGTSLVYEGRYNLKDGRLVRVHAGPKEYEGIAFRAEGTRWVWAGERKNSNLAPYVGSVLRRPKPMSAEAMFNELGQSRLYLAALDNDEKEIVRLLTTGANIDLTNQDKRRRTALYAAIDMGHVPLVALLLDKGANVNYQDGNGVTPLMAAGQSSGPYPALVRLLLSKGADATIKDKQGLTALARLKKAGATGFEPTLVQELNAQTKIESGR